MQASVQIPRAGAEPANSRTRLLAATESILLAGGFGALTTRAIAQRAATNISQIRYYFGSLEGLVGALLEEELGCIARAFAANDPPPDHTSLETLVKALFRAVHAPAAYAANGFAALAVEEIYHHVQSDLRAQTAATLKAGHGPFLQALARLLPDHDPFDLYARFTAIIAMAMGMLPRGPGRRLLAIRYPDEPARSDQVWRELVRLAVAGLSA